ncbi:hypothetical protein CPB84DRAFT_1767731 [Gymnopilus junonius]|uniref:F-box domain-containing protein n=1 Tax=Gymnopilus junonius TaxID=109634 RepID=A0A9P5NWL5_GYMJU|nr:hypothetical protein CPB84DRAFT_1767731 [Gymnopilus junonius]
MQHAIDAIPLLGDDSYLAQAILKDRINSADNLTIHHLPTEILTQVFSHHVEAQQPFLQGYTSRFSKVECSAPLVLSAVCRTWREIALDIPQLWTSPYIFLYSDNKLALQKEIIAEWFVRSRHLPLHISFFSTRRLGSAFSILSPVFDEVKAHSKRWVTLRLILSRYSYPVFTADLLDTPSLQRLQLWPRLDDRDDGPKFLLHKSILVEDVQIQNLSIWDFKVQWSALVVFRMRYISTDQVIELLRRAEKLERCVFSNIIPTRAGHHLPPLPLTHHSLKDLVLQSSEMKELEYILEHMVLPSLVQFVYSDTSLSALDEGRLSNHFPLHPFLSLFTRSRCSLKGFEMQALYTNTAADAELIEILEQLPSVERLSLGSVGVYSSRAWLSDPFFTDHANFVSLTRLLPHLKEFHITGTRAFSWDALLAFLNLAHSHITSTTRSNRINVRLDLDIKPRRPCDYIPPHIVSQLADSRSDQAISLQIIDRVQGENWIQASLVHHWLDSVASSRRQPGS